MWVQGFIQWENHIKGSKHLKAVRQARGAMPDPAETGQRQHHSRDRYAASGIRTPSPPELDTGGDSPPGKTTRANRDAA